MILFINFSVLSKLNLLTDLVAKLKRLVWLRIIPIPFVIELFISEMAGRKWLGRGRKHSKNGSKVEIQSILICSYNEWGIGPYNYHSSGNLGDLFCVINASVTLFVSLPPCLVWLWFSNLSRNLWKLSWRFFSVDLGFITYFLLLMKSKIFY